MWSIKDINDNNKAFTLLETAVVIAVLGMILAAVLMPYNLWRKNQAIKTTEMNISTATAAITNFLVQRGRYPCPARIDASRGDADYGLEGICDDSDPNYPTITNPGGPTVAGTFADGYYYERGRRVVDMDPAPGPPVNAIPVVRRGALPFRTLGLSEDQSEDGYGMRLQYTINENLATTNKYVQESGAIRVTDVSGNSLVNPSDSAHYVIFSTGEDKAGGYSRDGILVGACDVTHKDGENCNTLSGGGASFADYIHATYSKTDGANHYDDSLKFYSSVETPLWRVADPTGLHIRDLIGAETGGRIGIGISNPVATLDVAGEIRADNGNSMVSELCSSGGSDCIDVSKFGDPAGNADYQCGGDYAVGISGSKPGGGIDCKPAEIKCPAGRKMKGIKPDGTPDCGTFDGCVSRNIVLCGANIVTLPTTNRLKWADLSSVGGTSDGWTPTVGYSYKERWKCAYGSWRREATTGICSCTPSVTTRNVACNDRWNGNWAGTIEVRTEVVCPSGNVIETEGPNTCICVPTSQNGTSSCPSGAAWTGTKITRNDWTCSSATSGSWSGWYVVPPDNYCTCAEGTTETQYFACQSGYKPNPNGIEKSRTYDCATLSWSSWTPTGSNDCVCDTSTPPDERTVMCIPPLVGNIIQRADWDCSLNGGLGGYGPWYDYQNNCGAVIYKYVAKTTAKAGAGPLPTSLGQACAPSEVGTQKPCSYPRAGGGYDHYDVCQCE